MFSRTSPRILAALMLATALSLSAFAADPNPAPAKGYQAITKPSKDVTVSFVRPGHVVDVLISKGDQVKANQLIARQDDTEEQAALAIDKLQSEDETEIRAEESVAELAAVTLKRTIESSAPQLEIDKAKLEVVIDQARIQIAKTKLQQSKLKYEQTKIAVEKLKVLAPIDGIVAEEFLKAGESADGGNMKVVRIVQLDPLRVEVPVPVSQARQLKIGDAATVTSDDTELKQLRGKITVISPVGDSASGTILIRVDVPNPDKMRAGDSVYVKFCAPVRSLDWCRGQALMAPVILCE